MFVTRVITQDHKDDIRLKNYPFKLFGLLLPSYNNGKWDHTELLFPAENVTEMCFPDENYDYEEMSQTSVFVGAYDGEQCVGLAILQEDFFKYMYLYDLKVNPDCRGQGAGRLLIQACKELAVQKGYKGLYTQGQDNNLGACRFYLSTGFEIGGLNTHVYKGTPQEHKKDIFFYCNGE